MSAAFDCRCTWKLAGQDLPDLHVEIAQAGAFVEERPDVALSILARSGDHETLELSLEAHDEDAARTTLEEIITTIETAVNANGALRRGTLTVETASDEDEVSELSGSSFPGNGLDGGEARNDSAGGVADLVAVLDPYERMRDRGTSGANYDLDTESIIERLEEWDGDLSFDFVDVGSAHVTLRFHSLPPDLEDFAAEAYGFCPDLASDYDIEDEDAAEDATTDRAVVEAVSHGLREDRLLRLWWD